MISVVILARNEETNIAAAVRSAAWSDDVVVVDDHSTDGTRRIAAECGARVVTHGFESFARQRNWALDCGELRHPWVLMLDADEVSTDEFAAAARSLVANAPHDLAGCLVCRRTMFLGRWLRRSDGFPVWIARIVHRERARFIDHGHGERAVAVELGAAQTGDGAGGNRFDKIDAPLLHFPVSHGISDWVARHNRYSTREALLEQRVDNQRPPWRDLLCRNAFRRRQALRHFSRRLPARPLLRFIQQYVLHGGFLEGRAGFAWCAMMASYEALIVVKRWELAAKPSDDLVPERAPNGETQESLA